MYDIATMAFDEAPSTIAEIKEIERKRELRKNPWLDDSASSNAKAHVPRVFARALRSLMRNGELTAPRARKLIEMYRRAPTLEEEDESANGSATARSVASLVGEAVKLAEEDEPEEDHPGDPTHDGQRDTHGRVTREVMRREEALIDTERMHRCRELHDLASRRRYLEDEVALKHADQSLPLRIVVREHVRNDKQVKADTWNKVILDEQARMDALISEPRTLIWARHIEWSPKLTKVVTKERQIVDEETGGKKDPSTGSIMTESYEEEVLLTLSEALEIEAKELTDRIVSVTKEVTYEVEVEVEISDRRRRGRGR